MKKLKLITLILILFIPGLLFAGSVQQKHKAVIAALNVAAPGAECPDSEDILLQEDFEDFSDGDEWSVSAGSATWVELDATVDMFVADDNDTITPQEGSFCGLIDGGNFPADKCYASFTEVTSGYLNWVFYFWYTDNSTPFYDILYEISDNTSAVHYSRVDGDGYVEPYSDGGYVPNVARLNDGAWNKIEVRINIDDSDGIECLFLYVNGVEYGPYDSVGRVDPDGIDRTYFREPSGGVDDFWVDDMYMYTGARCE